LVNKSQKFSSNSLNNNNLSCLSPRNPSPSVLLRTATFPAGKINFTPLFYHSSIYVVGKVIYPKYSKHWLSTMAYTIDCVFRKISNHGLNHGLLFSLFKLFGWKNSKLTWKFRINVTSVSKKFVVNTLVIHYWVYYEFLWNRR
jgi:hypothetical protein